MPDEQDVVDVVDEIVDDIDPSRFMREAAKLGLTVEELIGRVANELRARIPYA